MSVLAVRSLTEVLVSLFSLETEAIISLILLGGVIFSVGLFIGGRQRFTAFVNSDFNGHGAWMFYVFLALMAWWFFSQPRQRQLGATPPCGASPSVGTRSPWPADSQGPLHTSVPPRPVS